MSSPIRPSDRPLQDRIRIIQLFFQHGSRIGVVRHWNDNDYPGVSPNSQTISSIVDKFLKDGTVLNYSSTGRPKSTLTDEKLEEIAMSIAIQPIMSTTARADELDIDTRSLRRGISELGFHGYKLRRIHEIKDTDKIKRMFWCQHYRFLHEIVPNFAEVMFFSDECHFALTQSLNRHNVYYYATENPHFTMEIPHDKRGVTVWCAFSSRYFCGPYFFHGTVRKENYIQMLLHYFIPRLQGFGIYNRAFFQQDGASAHTARLTLDFLREHFPFHVISKGGTYNWPPRSPDLTPPDIWLWAYLKDRVFAHPRPTNVEELMNKIRAACATITPEMLANVAAHCLERASIVFDRDGDHYED